MVETRAASGSFASALYLSVRAFVRPAKFSCRSGRPGGQCEPIVVCRSLALSLSRSFSFSSLALALASSGAASCSALPRPLSQELPVTRERDFVQRAKRCRLRLTAAVSFRGPRSAICSLRLARPANRRSKSRQIDRISTRHRNLFLQTGSEVYLDV